MILDQRLYPYKLEPQEKPAIWGGDALRKRYGKTADRDAAIGESWECWDANVVLNGDFAGSTLADLRGALGTELMGRIDPQRIFPVLTKIIDARQSLSVQVHPDDAYAQRVEQQRNGKTECWYILAALPGAELVLGWTRATDRSEYERRVKDGSLGEILRRVPVCSGEAYFIPAGMLHAIGAGIQLFEAQQASDLTYRIFDWNRLGSDGRPRELAVAKAGDVLDFSARAVTAVTTLTVDADGIERTLLVANQRFGLERSKRVGAEAALFTYGRPLTLTALETPLCVMLTAERVEVAPFATIVVPAAAERVTICSNGAFLAVSPEPPLDVWRRSALDAGFDELAITAFFGQFT